MLTWFGCNSCLWQFWFLGLKQIGWVDLLSSPSTSLSVPVNVNRAQTYANYLKATFPSQKLRRQAGIYCHSLSLFPSPHKLSLSTANINHFAFFFHTLRRCVLLCVPLSRKLSIQNKLKNKSTAEENFLPGGELHEHIEPAKFTSSSWQHQMSSIKNLITRCWSFMGLLPRKEHFRYESSEKRKKDGDEQLRPSHSICIEQNLSGTTATQTKNRLK